MPKKLGERLDGSRQAALVASSSVRVKNALAAHGVDHALGVLESFLSSGLVAGEDELANALDSGTVLLSLSRRARLQLGIWPKSAGSKFYYNVAFCASNDSPLQLCAEFARKQKTRHCIKSE